MLTGDRLYKPYGQSRELLADNAPTQSKETLPMEVKVVRIILPYLGMCLITQLDSPLAVCLTTRGIFFKSLCLLVSHSELELTHQVRCVRFQLHRARPKDLAYHLGHRTRPRPPKSKSLLDQYVLVDLSVLLISSMLSPSITQIEYEMRACPLHRLFAQGWHLPP